MAIQTQINSRLVFGGGQDLLTENVHGLNNLYFNLYHHQPKVMEDHSSISQIISSQMNNQRIEIDQYINFQSEKLRMALQEQSKKHTSTMMKKYEAMIQSLFRHKEEEILKASRRNMELQDCLRKMETERQTWQRVAQENEAMVESLKCRIQLLRESAAASGAAEDAESWCSGGEREERERWEQRSRKMVCTCCNSRNSCVIMLPCRHMCSCRDCDQFLDCCPICNVAKKASLQVLI